MISTGAHCDRVRVDSYLVRTAEVVSSARTRHAATSGARGVLYSSKEVSWSFSACMS